jgi:pilus assembly protein Flp/PilA
VADSHRDRKWSHYMGPANQPRESNPMLQFNYLKTWLLARIDSDRGASLVEYALLVALIAVVCIFAISMLGRAASDKFTEIADQLS